MRSNCPICGVEQLNQAHVRRFRDAEQTARKMVEGLTVCRDCLDIVDPAAYKDGEGLK